ncbi:hypothetical protein AJ80_02744 [Polytolypa hystricis UAMH7299]|uniref:Sugar phosphate transporter domain-containing protein n=1 Tax=Polytolypa hystricis (strain UAMH7299) TaxID=1447883 RepID=A0A2B7YNA9_POLH7|nr:hypothetical protein AJ80_02744 [Polytolypa hystricis UAMH7299]
MSTTTVIGMGHHPSMLSKNWQAQMPTNADAVSSPADQFPPFHDESANSNSNQQDASLHLTSSPTPQPSEPLWQPRKGALTPRDLPIGSKKRAPRKSISQALGNFRTRNASVSVNAQELAEALKAPLSYKLIALCLIWYTTSALTNTSSKSILNTLPKPITLTFVQFGFVPFWCTVLTHLASIFPILKVWIPSLKHGIRAPSVEIIKTALPLAGFQLAGHILSSFSTSQIPVSLVHTIKGLSPLFTVLAYRILFRIKYAKATYLSLIPLTVGVMLACSAGFSTNFFGILCAFCSTIVFVSQNIFSKKLFNEASRAESDGPVARKLDKLNLLFYCSSLAFMLTAPIWFLTEGYPLIADLLHDGSIDLRNKKGALDHGPLSAEFVFNGLFHFGQNILAFVLLSMISPVSYSVASLIKRVFVIVVAIVWFGSSTTPIQAVGIGLTFLGLYLYDRNNHDDAADRRANADLFRHDKSKPLLPLNNSNAGKPWDSNGYAFPQATKMPQSDWNTKKEDDVAGRPRRSSNAPWLPPGTKQESTWQTGDTTTSSQ